VLVVDDEDPEATVVECEPVPGAVEPVPGVVPLAVEWPGVQPCDAA
jgi:hypothetical protein